MEFSELELVDDLELAYIAGFVDGEGTISIHHRSGEEKANWYYIQVSVANTNISMPYRLKELFGGSISTQTRGTNRKSVYIWSAVSESAKTFVDAIKPYLRQKWEHAEIVLEFQTTMRHGHIRGRPGKGSGYTQEELQYKRFLFNEITALNRRGIGNDIVQEKGNTPNILEINQ